MSPCLCVLCAKFFALLVLVWVRARNSSPSTLKTPQFRRFCACWASFFAEAPLEGPCWASFFARPAAAPRSCWRCGTVHVGGGGGFALHEALWLRVAGVSEPHVVQFPPSGGEAATHSDVVPKVQTTSAKNAENGVLWVRWSTFWAQRCLSWCVVRTRTPEPAR